MGTKKRRYVLWGLLALLVAGGLVFAFWPRPLPVDMVRAEEGPLSVIVREEGQTRVKEVYQVSAPVAGELLRIDLDVGDTVIAGKTLIAEIEPAAPDFRDVRTEALLEAEADAATAAVALAEADVARARADLAFARSELERARRLIDRQVISERALDEAERAHAIAQAELRTTEARLAVRKSELRRAEAALLSPGQAVRERKACECVPVTAPIDGRILKVMRESEGVVQVGTPLVDIGDPMNLEVIVDLLSADAVRVAAGQRVELTQWGGETAIEGVVRRVEPYGFTKVSALGVEEQRVNVVIDFLSPRQAWKVLGHGYRVEAEIVVWESERTLKLPLGALFRAGEDWAVFAVEDGRARQRRVQVGRRGRFDVQILDGLSPGARVILHPSDQIAEGVRVIAR